MPLIRAQIWRDWQLLHTWEETDWVVNIIIPWSHHNHHFIRNYLDSHKYLLSVMWHFHLNTQHTILVNKHNNKWVLYSLHSFSFLCSNNNKMKYKSNWVKNVLWDNKSDSERLPYLVTILSASYKFYLPGRVSMWLYLLSLWPLRLTRDTHHWLKPSAIWEIHYPRVTKQLLTSLLIWKFSHK